MLSPNIERRISEINANAEQTQKKIDRRLTLLTIALPICYIFGLEIYNIIERVSLQTFYYFEWLRYTSDLDLALLFYVSLTILFLFVTVYFANLLNKPKFVTVYLNNEPRTTDRDDGIHNQPLPWLTRVKDFTWAPRTRLFVFMAAYLVLIASIVGNGIIRGNLDSTEIYILAIIPSLGSIVCHTLFPRAPRMRLFVFMAAYLVLILLFVKGQIIIFSTYGSLGYIPQPIGLLVFLLSILGCFLLGYKALVETRDSEVTRHEPLFHNSIYQCVSVLPEKVYVGGTHNILAEFDRSECSNNESSGNNHVAMDYKNLEVELNAAGVTIDGEKKYRLLETSHIPTCLWNCHFKNAGDQAVTLVLRAIQPNDQKNTIFRHRFDIKVNSAFSASVQPSITIIVSITSIIILIIQNLHLR